MNRLLTALALLGCVAGPASAQERGFETVVALRPFVDIAPPDQWAPVANALRRDGLWPIFDELGIDLTPRNVHAAVVDMIAGGQPELIVSFRQGCGNSGCWTYLLEVQNGTWQIINNTVLPDVFRVWRNPGETHSTISGYRHGLYWNGAAWVQFCTDTLYCG